MASVKWLTSIEITSGGWWGTEMDVYCYRRSRLDPTPLPIEQLPVRAMMAPPGHPDFYSRARLLAPGVVRVRGKVWAGAVDIDYVEFSSDGAKTWQRAEVGDKSGAFGWAAWHFDWDVKMEGSYVLSCRGVDAAGRTQDPLCDDQFNYTGMGSTQPQLVYVRVTADIETIGGSINLEVEEEAAKKPEVMEKAQWDGLYRAPGSQ